VDFQVSDLVWLSMKSYYIGWPSKKLNYLTNSKFKILEKVRNSYHLDLLASIAIYPIVSLNKLYKAANDPLPGK
jgi:hypothetical protein